MEEQSIKIKKEKPPIWDSLRNAFNINIETTIFTYGDTIYNPAGVEIPDHVIAHEKVHIKQQTELKQMTPAVWWGRYLREPDFRIDQEARAYAKQYLFICKTVTDRNQRARVLVDLAQILSGPMYNNVINQFDAVDKIKKFIG